MGTVPYQIEYEKSLYQNGDKGTTGIHGGARVPKDDIRIEANGCLDELNAVIGIVRSMLAAEDGWQELLHAVQRELMVVMSHVATPSGVVNPNPLSAAELTLRCEQEMDAMTVLLTDNGYFLFAWWHSHISPTAVCPYRGPPCRTPFVDTPSPRPRERGYSALHQPPFGLVLRHGPHGDAAAGLAGGEMARVCLQKKKDSKHLSLTAGKLFSA